MLIYSTLEVLLSLRCYFQNIYNVETEKYEQFVANSQFDIYNKRFIRCGVCFNCKKMNAVEWTIKAQYEYKQWNYAYFITLTYNNENLPLELNTRDYQLFLKRIRKYFWEKYRQKLRYLIAGEYGFRYSRPHYHMILYCNIDLSSTFFKVAKKQYSSKFIEKFWGLGFITIAFASVETIAYTAFYSTKKLGTKQKFSFLDKYSKNGIVPKSEFIYASNGFGQQYVRDNLVYFLENWKILPKSLIKNSIFGSDFVESVKFEKQQLMLKLHNEVDWSKQRFEYRQIEKKQKEILFKKRNLKFN